ncbi:TPA: glycosyltransferase [Clostridium sporogenes]|uniref:glycosyltransferase n=1 Tax=Clostridium botulinum TaxID=1491 RepID=UPI000D126D91|nr:glycosyltransferase [Clostridium botulinum]AVQ44400.1 alpha/beta hydrolase [Clostridium botulinum]AVQ47943.1 alpha/beta hydrolase [Clostridium botulinum]
MRCSDRLNKKIIIFGASNSGKKLLSFLRSFNFDICYFVDNDKNKWGKIFYDKEIKDPKILKKINKEDYIIIIASMFIKEISEQLGSLGYNINEDYITMHSFIKKSIDDKFNKILNSIKQKSVEKHKTNSIFITLPSGFILGGVEIWSILAFKGLNEKYDNSYLMNLNPKNENKDYDYIKNYEDNILNYNIKENDYMNSIIDLCNQLTNYLPITIIPNHSEEMFIIGYILKNKYPSLVNVVSVLHSDLNYVYDMNKCYSDSICKFICVSKEIDNKFKEILPCRKIDIDNKVSPVIIKNTRKSYSFEKEPIKIGFAGRLIKEQKRCDLLMELIKELKDLKINFEINIAGDGEYYDIISEYASKQNLISKINLYGVIPHNRMNDFWASQDIYLNVSDYEGTSLAMLEALGNGAVPIVTGVSGVQKVVDNNINGFIVQPGSAPQILEHIKYFYDNRCKLQEFGQKSINKINDICCLDTYVTYLHDIC